MLGYVMFLALKFHVCFFDDLLIVFLKKKKNSFQEIGSLCISINLGWDIAL